MAHKKENVSSEPTVDEKANNASSKKSSKSRWIFRFLILMAIIVIGVGIAQNLKFGPSTKTASATNKKPGSLFVIPSPKEVVPVEPVVSINPVNNAQEKALNTPTAADILPGTPGYTQENEINPDTVSIELNAKDVITKSDEEIPGTPAYTKAHEQPQNPITIEVKAPADVQKEAADLPGQPVKSDGIYIELQAPKDQESKAIKQNEHDFTAGDALRFRDHFLSDQPCAEDLRHLMFSDVKNKQAQEVIRTTSQFCLTAINGYTELTDLFVKSRKQALKQYYQELNPGWTSKMRGLLTSVITVRNLNPTGNTVPEILDRAHNALVAKDVDVSVEVIDTLPPSIKESFTEYIQKTKGYIEAKTALDRFVLSYAKGE